ncbi:MAG: CAP domain-containing protein [Vicingaceae bacterium]|nr:CAP domain-containing protein [Vicingaceae bacterium]
MKFTRLMWWLAMCIIPTVASAQTHTYQDVSTLLKKAEKDSIAYIERTAALEFHKLINEYRKENGLSTIEWNETLWIATQNHNLWMAKTGNLSHHQTTNNKYYTGKSPGDRLNYAQAGSSSFGWSGENALYNYSHRGTTKDEIAKNIAKSSFKQWKNSPGHNENMLSKRHGSHGVAFRINGGVVWGTDLFSSYNKDYSPTPSTFYAKKETKSSAPNPRTKRFSTAKNRRMVYEDVKTNLNDDLNLKAKNWTKKDGVAKRLAYRIANKKYKTKSIDGVIFTETQETSKKALLGLFNKKIYTYSAVIEKDIDEFDSTKMSQQLTSLLKDNQPFNKKSKVDVAVILKKRKNLIRVTLVSVMYNSNRKLNIF